MITERNFYRINMKDLHACMKRGGPWLHSVDSNRTALNGYRETETFIFWSSDGLDACGRRWIFYRRASTGSVGRLEGHVEAEATPCRFGGRRWWFVCPVTGKRSQCLFFVGGRWVSRQAAPFRFYASQLTHVGLARREEQSARCLGRFGVPERDRQEMLSNYLLPPPSKGCRCMKRVRLIARLQTCYENQHDALLDFAYAHWPTRKRARKSLM